LGCEIYWWENIAVSISFFYSGVPKTMEAFGLSNIHFSENKKDPTFMLHDQNFFHSGKENVF